MRAIYEIGVIHVEITNACNKVCACCTRFCGHHRKPYFMDIEIVEKAMLSLKEAPNRVGIMGGEPTIHPEFKNICKLLQKHIALERRALWTNGARWAEYEAIIDETFLPKNVVYNDHSHTEGHHQPLLAPSDDILKDRQLWRSLVDKCWIQQRWSASITPKGCFFCEVAAALDMLFDGPGGYPIEPGWWNKTPSEFQDQIERYCVNCSAAIPMPAVDANKGKDVVSPRIAKMLHDVNSPRYAKGNVSIAEEQLDAEKVAVYAKSWKPWSHRPFRQCGPNRFLDDDGNVVSHKVFHKG
jgi:hypothetical protein